MKHEADDDRELRNAGHGGGRIPLARPFGPSVEKIQVTWIAGRYTAVPGNAEDGGGVGRDEIGGTTRINTYEQALTLPDVVSFANRVHGGGPPDAIMIAPDSPIDCCDLWFGSNSSMAQRFRVGVGCPLIGLPSDLGEARITLPRAIPDPFDMSAETSANFLAENDVFDSNRGKVAQSNSPLDDRAEYQFPLRLLVLRGAAPSIPHVRRAPYVADAYYALDGAATAYAQLWIVTMGRASVEVMVSNMGANPLLATISGHDGTLKTKGGVNTNNDRVRNHVISVLDAVAVPAPVAAIGGTLKRTYNEPFSMYSVRIDHGGLPVKAAIEIVARDA